MKVPTKHGLDRKFKPWRKGKSSKSKKRSSLKQQLRGHERLLAKIVNTAEKDPKQEGGGEEEKTQELKNKITALKQEIAEKQQSMVEKKHAEKSHGQRFLDRQRLTRLEKKVRKSDVDNNEQEKQLIKLALDQVYVAHHPNDVKYMPLFKYGKRVVDQSRHLFRRAVTRKRILKDVKTYTKVSWIIANQYERLPTKDEWTIQDEERVFGGSVSRSNKDNTKSVSKTEDSRFAMASNHEAVLKAAEQAESELLQQDKEEEQNNDGDNMDIIDSGNKKTKTSKGDSKKDDSSSSSSDDSDSDDEEVSPMSSKMSKKSGGKEVPSLPSAKEAKPQQKKQEDDSSSSSDSDSSSESKRRRTQSIQ